MNKLIFLGLIPVLMLTVPTVHATALSRCDDPEPTEETCRDFVNYPEAYCINYNDDPKCEKIDICDDEGGITSEDQYCTGEAVSNLPYPPGGCPEGYHSVEDDESGQCYSDEDVDCPENTIMKDFDNSEGHSCVDYKLDCSLNKDHPLCNGVERYDGIGVCDQPDHPGYKFCNTDEGPES